MSRATSYRTLKHLAGHGLVQHTGETWALAPRALEGFGDGLPGADTGLAAAAAQGWDKVAEHHGTAGVAARRNLALGGLKQLVLRGAGQAGAVVGERYPFDDIAEYIRAKRSEFGAIVVDAGSGSARIFHEADTRHRTGP